MAERQVSLTQFLNACNREHLQRIAVTIGQSPDTTIEVLRSGLNVYFRSHPEEMSKIPGMESLIITRSTPSPTPPVTDAEGKVVNPLLQLHIPLRTTSGGITPPRADSPPPRGETSGAGSTDPMRALGDLFNVVMARSDDRLAALLNVAGQQQRTLMETTLEAVRQIADQAIPGSASAGEASTSADGAGRPSASLGSFLKVARARSLRFTGRDNESFSVFIKHFQDALALFRLNDTDKRRALGDLVAGSARHVFDHVDRTAKSFGDVLISMKSVYVSPDQQMKLKMTLLTRMQGESERSVHWLMSMRQLNSDLDCPLSTTELLSILRAHLHPKVSSLLRSQDHDRFEELVADACGAEAILERHKSYVPPTRAMLTDVLYGDSNALYGTAPKPHVLTVTATPEADAISAPRTNKGAKGAFKPRQPPAEHTCKGCGTKGHYEKDCLTTPKPFCYFCGHQGVVAGQCDCRGRRAPRVTLDSAASQAERALFAEYRAKLDALQSQQGN